MASRVHIRHGAASGAALWLAYGVVETWMLGILPWLSQPMYSYRPLHAAEVKTEGAIVSLTITRTGTIHRVEYDSRAGSAHVTTTSRNMLGLLNRIHHASGIAHDYWAVNGWGWVLLTTSCALLVLAITGIVMWFKRHEDRVLGAMVTTIGLAWGVTLLVLMRIR